MNLEAEIKPPANSAAPAKPDESGDISNEEIDRILELLEQGLRRRRPGIIAIQELLFSERASIHHLLG